MDRGLAGHQAAASTIIATAGALGITRMTAEQAHGCCEAIRRNMDHARALLLELYERDGWVALGYSSFTACAQEEFGKSHAGTWRELLAAEIEREISPNGELGHIPTSHCTELAKVPAGERAEVYKEAVANGPTTASTLARAAFDRLSPEQKRAYIAEQEARLNKTGATQKVNPRHLELAFYQARIDSLKRAWANLPDVQQDLDWLARKMLATIGRSSFTQTRAAA